jgi:hypothetical protein
MTRSNLKLFTLFMVNPLILVIAKAEPVAIHCSNEIEPHTRTLHSRHDGLPRLSLRVLLSMTALTLANPD